MGSKKILFHKGYFLSIALGIQQKALPEKTNKYKYVLSEKILIQVKHCY